MASSPSDSQFDIASTKHELDRSDSPSPAQSNNNLKDEEPGNHDHHALEHSTSLSRHSTATRPPAFSAIQEYIFIAVVISAQLFTQACLAVSISPLHFIGSTFNTTNPGMLSWLPAGFSLTVGTFILPAGRWGDLFGHKTLFVIGYAWLSIWSLVAGFCVWSGKLWFFAFCRGMQGIGCGIILPNGIAVLARTYPPGPRKNMVLSIFGATAPGGFVLGAVFSGIFSELVWWPWSYWVMGMWVAVVGVAAMIVIPAMPVSGQRTASIIDELDLWGTILGVSGLVLFNFAWNQGPVVGWQTVYVYLLLIVGSFMIVIFIMYEMRLSRFPLLPSHAFSRDTNLVFGCIAAGWASFGIFIFYFWQFLQELQGDSSLLVAAKICPVAFSGATAAIVTGLLISKIQPGFLMLISMCAFCTGQILLATNPVGRSYWAQYFVATLIIPWGMDISFPSSVIVLSNHMPPSEQGVAASLVNTVLNYSISIGLGMAGTVESQVNDGGKNLLKGYRGAWYLGIGLDVLGICLACCLILSWKATVKAKLRAEQVA